MARRMETCGWRDQCGAAIRASGPNRGLRNRSGFHKQSGALTHAHTQYHAAHPVWLLTFWTDHRLRAHHNQHDVLRSVRAGKIQGHNRFRIFSLHPGFAHLAVPSRTNVVSFMCPTCCETGPGPCVDCPSGGWSEFDYALSISGGTNRTYAKSSEARKCKYPSPLTATRMRCSTCLAGEY